MPQNILGWSTEDFISPKTNPASNEQNTRHKLQYGLYRILRLKYVYLKCYLQVTGFFAILLIGLLLMFLSVSLSITRFGVRKRLNGLRS